MRRVVRMIALCLIPVMLSGCWSYRSLSDISIVMGFSIDMDPATRDFLVSAEIADLSKSPKQGPPGSKLVEAKGQTIFEAFREAKRRLNNRLYFSNTQVVAIGEQTARTEGILGVVDWIMRDAEPRETLMMLIAKGGDGKALFKAQGLDQSIISLEIDSIITDDNKVTSSTSHEDLYQVYDILNGQGMSLTLPVFHITDNDGQKVIELDGAAAFKDDKLVGFLSPEESKYFLIATGECNGGILALAMHGKGTPDTSLEISGSSAKTTFTTEGGKLAFRIETETKVYLAETMDNIDVLKQDQIEALEEEAGRRLEMEIGALIKRVQTELKSDIFGFGHILHKHDLPQWRQVQNQWDSIFETLPVWVDCKVKIVNTAQITSKEAIKQ